MMVYNALNDTIVSFLTYMHTKVCIKGDMYYAANNYITYQLASQRLRALR